ncbi:MAG: carboxymuconolactone decarboxylase family protein, partial [Polyangiales bacterium]
MPLDSLRPIPRVYRVPALFRDLLSVLTRAPSLISIWIGGRLPRALREQVVVAVAQANACRMCEHAHTRMALEAGVTDAELAALENMDPEVLDRRTWLALAYARER